MKIHSFAKFLMLREQQTIKPTSPPLIAMKPSIVRRIAICSLLLAAGPAVTHAQTTLTWDPGLSGGSGGTGTWNLTTANWYNGTADVKWTDTSAIGTIPAVFAGTAGTVTLNTSLSASNLLFNTSGYNLSGSGPLKLGAGGINASSLTSGATTIGIALSLPAVQQPWQVGSGSTLAINGSVSRTPGAGVDFTSSGITTTSLANDAGGIIDGWATTGNYLSSQTTGDFLSVSDGNIVICTNYLDVSSSGNTTLTTGTIAGQNLVSGALNGANNISTVAANVTINSLVQQGDFIVNNGVTMTLGSGGLIMRGGSRWLIDQTASALGTAVINSGLPSGELFIHMPDGGADSAANSAFAGNWRIWTGIQNNGATPGILVKDGPGMISLQNANTYSGGTIINNGILTSGVDNTATNAGTLGTGTITIDGPGILEVGFGTANANLDYFVTNSVVFSGGSALADDGHQHLSGPINISAAGATFGSTYDGGANASTGNKGLFLDGLISGSGPISLEQSSQAGASDRYGNAGGNAYNSSVVEFGNNANTYSGTITIVPYTTGSGAGSYLAVNGSTALQSATVVVQNNTGGQRFSGTPLIFNTGLGSATLGQISGSGNIILNGFNENTYALQSDAIALSVGGNNTSTTESGNITGTGSLTKTGTGTLTLSGVETYTGNTTISGGTLALSGNSILSTNIIEGTGATFDVSGVTSFGLAGYQALFGGGTVKGNVGTTLGSKIYAGTDGGYGTATFNNNLTLASGAAVYFDLGTSSTGPNDLITVGGTLTTSGNIIHIKAPSTSSSLQAADYTLFTSANAIFGSFASAPSWDVQPVNSGNFTVVTSGNTVKLHYASATAPSGSGTAIPTSATRNQTVLVTVNAINGSGGTVVSVTLDANSIGGSSSVALVNAGGNVWTNSVTVAPTTAAGSYTLAATLTDTVPLTGLVNIPLTVTVANNVWNGQAGNAFFSSNLNWVSKAAPGYVGDSLEFAGTVNLSPDMNNNYSVTGITFDNGAGSFNIGSAESDTLTLTGSGTLVNNSVNAQTLNVVIADAGGGITKSGLGTINLAGNNTYTGQTVVSGGTLNVSGTSGSSVNTIVGSAASNAALGLSGSGTLNAFFLLVGNVSGAVGAIYQTGGTLNANANSTYDNLCIGNVAGSYGYYAASGGTATINGVCVGGEDNNGTSANFGGNGGNGILDVENGGALNCTGWLVMSRCANGEMGILNVYNGGTLTYAGGGIVVNWGAGQTSIINILGGSVATTGAVGVGLGSSGTAVLNLDGGVLNATIVSGSFGGTYGQVSFNGGTLQAFQGNANFLHVSSATVYSGGGTIDNNGQAIGITQPLLTPAGNGIYGIASFTGGAGYIAPPIVTVVPGAGDTTGTGATAIAQINPVTGTVTNIVITCPGVNYTATPTFTLSGGGATTPATITGTAPTANASGGLTSIGTGSLTLSGASTYSGATMINAGSLLLTTGGSINNSTNIIVSAGATFDVSGITYTMAAGQILSGNGTINGSVNTVAGSGIAAGLVSSDGTNTFNNDLTLASGAVCYLKLGTAYNGPNDLIVVDGTVTANGNSIHLKAPSTSSSLDTTADYVLISSPSSAISGKFASAPIWDVPPANAAHYSIVTSANAVTLHYNASVVAPSVTASANPTTLSSSQTTKITATVTPGSGTITSVSIDLGPIGGSVVALVQTGSSTVYTNTVTIPPTANPGSVVLTVTATDNTPLSGAANVSLSIVPAAGVWTGGGGGNQNWSNGANWLGGVAPAFSGDSLTFAGSVGVTPNMDNNYSIPSLTFSNNAGSFNIGSANSSTLTLSDGGSIINNSANTQTLNVTIADTGGGLAKGGKGTVSLPGNSTYTGQTTVNAGTLNVSGTLASTVNTVVGNSTSNSVLNISGSASMSPFYVLVGNVSNSVGAIYQTGGTLTVNSNSGFDNLCLGNVPGSYGYYDAVGGTATINGICIGGEANNGSTGTFNVAGNGVMDLNGETVTDTGWLLLARNNNNTNGAEIGVLNVFSGSLTYAGGGIVGPWDQGQTGIINMMGGTVATTAAVGVYLGYTNNTGILNLNGGVLNASVIAGYNGPVYTVVTAGHLNFNGGTLQASASSSGFITVSDAKIYSGGATIDNNGNSITIAQPLLAPAGKGVGILSFTPGAGYIAPPIVLVVPGAGDTTGFGATAIAEINPLTGTVTNVVVTCPGVNYTVTPTFTLIGGGATTPATITGLTPTANTGGGLTAIGSGITTLSGVNTYTGNTTVSAGTLEIVQSVLAPPSTVSVASGAVLQLDFATTNAVSGLVLNGVSQAAGVYNSANSSPYITGSGSLLVGSFVIAPNPTNIIFSVSGSGSSRTLNLSWPADHLGWILQAQTNSLSSGLSLLAGEWFDVPGSGSTTSASVPINPAQPTVFYRLRHP